MRHRRELLAQRIDEIAEDREGCRILSVACGHLREAQQANSVEERRVAEYYAIDQDPESVALIAKEQSRFGVRPMVGTVGQLLKGQLSFHNIDFAYAAGLYDYLPDSLAIELTRVIFRTLSPGGRLLVANFASDIPEAGYMEAFMDWNLIYRSETEVTRWISGINDKEISDCNVWRDPNGSIIYLEVQRR